MATQPEWHLAEAHLDRDDGYRGSRLNRPGLDRRRDRAALAVFARVLMTAPDCLARHDVPQVLRIDELAQRGCEVECLDRPMSQDPHDQLLLQIRGAGAEDERTLISDRRRRGRQATWRSGPRLPWRVPPYGSVMDPERPRDPQRLRRDPVNAAVITPILAWYTDPQTPATRYRVAKRLTDDHIPTPRGGPRWNVASVRGILRSPVYTGTADRERTRPVPARIRQSALRPVGPGHSHRPAPPEAWMAIPGPRSSARRPSRWRKPAWRGIPTWPAGTTPLTHTCSAAWSVVARVNWRVWGAPSPPALTTISAAVGPMRCGRPGASAAPRGLPRPEPWMSWSGRICAGS